MKQILIIGLVVCGSAATAQSPPPPRPALIFISPMGEPFRDGSTAAGLERWFSDADADHDGGIALAELAADAARFFRTLDVDGDGEIAPVEMNRYEREVAPEIQLGTERFGPRERRRLRRIEAKKEEARGSGQLFGGSRENDDRTGLEGAGRFGLINIPQPVIDADSDFNRGVGRAEFAAAAGRRFLVMDTDRDGRLTRPELLALLPKLPTRKHDRR
jgi:Ca2+-binding EF-hand superfamily protein